MAQHKAHATLKSTQNDSSCPQESWSSSFRARNVLSLNLRGGMPFHSEIPDDEEANHEDIPGMDPPYFPRTKL
jgi:hypothetical protein